MFQFVILGQVILKSHCGIFAITNILLKYIEHSTKHALSILGTRDVKDSGTGLQDTCTLMG